jgi:hypothetical protein
MFTKIVGQIQILASQLVVEVTSCQNVIEERDILSDWHLTPLHSSCCALCGRAISLPPYDKDTDPMLCRLQDTLIDPDQKSCKYFVDEEHWDIPNDTVRTPWATPNGDILF